MATRAELERSARRAADRYGIPQSIFLRLLNQESGFNPNAVSPAGAAGIAQFMPGTWQGVVSQHPDLARDFNLTGDPSERTRNPFAAIFLAAAHLRDLALNAGNIRDALVGYNAGPGMFGTPTQSLPNETQSYLNSILGSNHEDFFNLNFDQFVQQFGTQTPPQEVNFSVPFGPDISLPIPGTGGETSLDIGDFGDPVVSALFQSWLAWQYNRRLAEQQQEMGFENAAFQSSLNEQQAQRDFQRRLRELAIQNQWSEEQATVAFERSLQMLGIQQQYQTSEREASQEFESEQAALDRELNVRLNRLSAETQLANTIAQLQESARQQAVDLLGRDPQRGAIAARGVQSIGRSPVQRFRQGLREFATEELPEPSTSESSVGDIEGNISELQDLFIQGTPPPPVGLGAASGARKKAGQKGLARNTGGTAILVGEGKRGEGLRAGTAEVAIFRDDGSAEIVPLAGMAQSGFTFDPGVGGQFKKQQGGVGGMPSAGEGEAPGLKTPRPIGADPDEFQDFLDDFPVGGPPSTPSAPATGEVSPDVAGFVADLFARDPTGITATDALRAQQLGLATLQQRILQYTAGLISYDDLIASVPDHLIPVSEREFATEAQALYPIFERLGIDFVPLGGRDEEGGLFPSAGEFRAGLPRPLLGEASSLFDALGTTPRVIREAETGAYFFRNSAGELRKIGDETNLLTTGLRPEDAITLSSADIAERPGDVQSIVPGEAATDISANPFLSGPIFSPLDEEENVGIFLPNPNQLAALWPTLSETEKSVIQSAYGLAGTAPTELGRSIRFHTPSGSGLRPARAGVLS